MKHFIGIIVMVILFISLASAELKVVIMGDNRPSGEYIQPYIFHKMVKKIASLKPDAVFSTGDIIIGYTDDVKKVGKMFDEFDKVIKILGNIPLYIAPGNHDMVFVPAIKEEYMRRYGKTYYSVDLEDSHFIILSSEESGERSMIAGEQLKWLKKDLEKARDKQHKFILVHQPFYPKVKHIGSSLDRYPDERNKLVELLKKCNVEMTFCGHIHIFNYSVNNGFHQIITGGAGAPLYGSGFENGGFYHFIYIIINGEDVDYRIVMVENEMEIAGKLRNEKKFDEAALVIKNAFKILPNHPEPHISKALLHTCQGDDIGFNKEFDILLTFKNNDKEDVLLDLAYTAFFTDNNSKLANKFLNRVIKEKPDSFRAYFQLAYMHNMKNKQDLSLKYFNKVIAIKPDHFKAYYYLGKIFYNKKDFSKAKHNFEKALKYCDNSADREYIIHYLKRCEKHLNKED